MRYSASLRGELEFQRHFWTNLHQRGGLARSLPKASSPVCTSGTATPGCRASIPIMIGAGHAPTRPGIMHKCIALVGTSKDKGGRVDSGQLFCFSVLVQKIIGTKENHWYRKNENRIGSVGRSVGWSFESSLLNPLPPWELSDSARTSNQSPLPIRKCRDPLDLALGN